MQRLRAVTPQRNHRHIYKPSLRHLSAVTGWPSPGAGAPFKALQMKGKEQPPFPLSLGNLSSQQNKISAAQKLPRGTHSKGRSSLEKAGSINHCLSAQKNVLFASPWRSKTRKEISFLYGWLNHQVILTSFSCNPSTHNTLSSSIKDVWADSCS